MDIIWQILQWVAAVIEIFLGYCAVAVFVQKGIVRDNKWYMFIWSIGLGSMLAYNRHWDVGLVSWPILILQCFVMMLTNLKLTKKRDLFREIVIVVYNICNALFQYLFCFAMITWGPCSDIQIVYMDMGIYRVSCYYLAISVNIVLLWVLNKRIKNQQQIRSFYKSFILYAVAGGWLFLALQAQLIGYGKERSTRYVFLLQLILLASVFILLGSIKSMETRAQLQLLDMKNRMLECNYREMKNVYQNYAFTFHDMKNHLLVLDQYCRRGEVEHAIEYIEKIREPILRNSYFITSDNETLDIILNFKLLEAEQMGIKTEIVVDKINDIRVEDNDLCCIIGNLLDNAIEACELINRENAWISVAIHLVGKMFSIHISNSCIEHEEKSVRTRLKKKKIQGYGIQSVEHVVEKYDGVAKWKKNKDTFSVNITIFDAVVPGDLCVKGE